MKKNLPVIDVETVLPDGVFIYSRTDLKGIIQEANEAFAAVSGFSVESMLGKPHNIVRHPDVPEAAFADMWRDLKAGRPWRGVVKNRRSDGGFYWVVANVSPVRENGVVVGYQSVRSRPSPEEIAAASAAYQRIAAGDDSLRIEHGHVVIERPWWQQSLCSFESSLRCCALAALLCSVLLLLQGWTPWLAPHVAGIVGTLVAVYALFFLMWQAPRTQRDLQCIVNALDGILCSGDLRTRFALQRHDLIGRLARNACGMVASLQATLQGIVDVSHQLNRATGAVHGNMADVHAAAQNQSAATASAAAAIEQITVSIGEVALNARHTRQAALQTGELSSEGARISRDASHSIQRLAETMQRSSEQIDALGRCSAEIGRIVGVIKEISDQTNLLALNAAIEAARAGEQGRGFSVVADEVRKLAERTGEATAVISGMISSIQTQAGAAVEGMRAGAGQVLSGVSLVGEAEGSLRRINENMDTTVQMVSDISHASSEQGLAMTEVARSVELVVTMTEHNAAFVEHTRSMVANLNNVGARMHKAVTQYRI